MAARILDRLKGQGVIATELRVDSRQVRAGDVFLAYPGAQADGRRFIAQAVGNGAAAVLWEERDYTLRGPLAVADLPVENLRALSGWLAHLVYGRPSEALWMVGVTGTNGKTTVSQWLAQCLDNLGRHCAVIGTLGGGFPGSLAQSVNTTPDAIALHRDLARYLHQGAQAAVMEVSSIGLDQGRVNGVAFDVAVLTNLTRDHLEYHGSMDAYAAAKARLFEATGLGHPVINLDDAFGRDMARRLRGGATQRVGYTLQPSSVAGDADIVFAARDIAVTARGLAFTVLTPQGERAIEMPLVGRFNVANLLAVLATLWTSGVALDAVLPHVMRLAPPRGRMQMLGGSSAPLVVVDYAHTPDALEQALIALRETARVRGGRLVCVFGCGGDRDRGKRPLMGEVAARCADRVWLTSDNPRNEQPAAIIAEIVAGLGGVGDVVEDRATAIAQAIAEAGDEDVVLIAGKGHEDYQEIGTCRLPFADAEHATQALAQRRSDAS